MPKIPEDERWVWDSPEIRESFDRGIEQAREGEIFDSGDFSQFANLPDEKAQ